MSNVCTLLTNMASRWSESQYSNKLWLLPNVLSWYYYTIFSSGV